MTTGSKDISDNILNSQYESKMVLNVSIFVLVDEQGTIFTSKMAHLNLGIT